MDLFVNESMFSIGSDANELLNISLENFNRNAAVLVRRKDAVRLLSLLQWFIKCSAIEKTNYLVRLANELSLDDLVQVIKPIKLFFGKPFMLSEATNGLICIDDKVLNDDNINLTAKTLQDMQENDFKWFYNLERIDQVEVIIGLTKILGVGSCRKLYGRLIAIYRAKHKVETKMIADIEAEVAARNHNLDDSSGGGGSGGEAAQTHADYALAGDAHTNVLILRNNWASRIANYRHEVFGQQPHSQSPMTDGANKGNKTKTKSKGQPSGTGTDTHQRLDQLQLLPLFISWKILSYLDNKTLAIVQKVNSYWSFAAGQVLAEGTARITLDKILTKMTERLAVASSSSSSSSMTRQQQITTKCNETSVAAVGRCDRRLQQLFERGTAIKSLHRAAPTAGFTSASILQDVYEQAHFPNGSFVLPTDGVCVLPRHLPAYKVDGEFTWQLTADALLVTAECPTQWLESSPGHHPVHKRPIAERQIMDAPMGRKVDAATTRRSTESLRNTNADDPINLTTETQQYKAQPSWHSSTGIGQDGPEEDVDVLSDLISTTRMKLFSTKSGGSIGASSVYSERTASTVTRPDAETVLKSFEQRISGYSLRSRIMMSSLDANMSPGAAFRPTPPTALQMHSESTTSTNQQPNSYH